MTPVDPEHPLLHATCVAQGSRGALIIGPSGAGKSGLAIQLIAMGCSLVSDDLTKVERVGDALIASNPGRMSGRIEARGIGILACDPVLKAAVVLVVDLGTQETERLPPFRTFTHLGCTVPLVRAVPSAHFPAAVMLCLKGGRVA